MCRRPCEPCEWLYTHTPVGCGAEQVAQSKVGALAHSGLGGSKSDRRHQSGPVRSATNQGGGQGQGGRAGSGGGQGQVLPFAL